ncbi:DNA-binding transcriptional regulator, LysR family [Edwardsiella anguillarum]|uniref:LysR substrate-binding domain-containing protein n=1 Tax=Edwardsiella TaxID=635 RepID=UPI00045C56C9|nr:LysR substrate-binding domain-containing protein [Edwardsiella anguillarum]AKM48146.1 transcriptional regulator [Edwardsiella sp. EA181011]GAJ66648.1 DNA-binding transcriptional activator [Edwardsiella piscicida]RFT03972.1 transcriptional regulator [Edwardsiella anguillarum]BET80578.1 DNA-binding transcriptional regulator, LysR family [Edwardsiella anguillarum]BET83867.1 DNA-binding transcriptional regulator, LysR family [Edwardsiella anguillarum]
MRYLPKIQQLKVFNEVIRSGSIRAAARKMDQSQPALTRTLKELEHHMGATLLIRSNEGVTLTDAGKSFAIRAHLILEELEKAAEEVEQITKNGHGHVAFGISSLFGITVLNKVLNDFKQGFPATVINVKEAQLSTLLPSLRDGRLDFALGTLTDEMPLGDFISISLFDAPFCIVARKEHPLANCSELEALRQAKWVMPETDMGYYHNIRRIIPFDHPDNPHYPILTDSTVCIMNLVMNGDYLTILSRARLREARFGGVLTALPIGLQFLPVGHYGLIYPRKRPLTQASQALIEQFRWHCQHHDWQHPQ